MSTKIDWCDETINPIVGCTKISPACDHCYAEVMAKRLTGMQHMNYKYGPVITDGKWNGNIVFDRKDLYKPEKWKTPRKIFITSMGDLFHRNVKWDHLQEIIQMILANPMHTFLMLTKRPDEMNIFFAILYDGLKPEIPIPIPNLWLGCTAENQEQAEKRIPDLLEIPARRHFVSCEPLLESINFDNIESPYPDDPKHIIDWVIVGKENGPGARELNEMWVTDIAHQCWVNNVPLYLKGENMTIEGEVYHEFPKL